MSRAAVRAVLTLVGALASAGLAGVGTWTQVGPIGPAAFVAVDPGNSALVYTEKFRSLDGGATWVPNNLNPAAPDVLAVGPSRTVYVGDGSALFVSRDAASSWTKAFTFVPFLPYGITGLLILAVDPSQPSTLYVSGGDSGGSPYNSHSFFDKSTDGGRSWTPLAVPAGNLLSGVVSVAVDPRASGTLYISVGGSPGLGNNVTYKSGDGGATWIPLPAPGNAVLAVDPQNPSTVYAMNRFGNSPVMRSLDGGATFVSTGASFGGGSQLIVSPTASSHIIALASAVMESTDGGATFVSISQGLPQPHSLAIDPTGRILYAATDSGVYSYQFDPGELHLNAAHSFMITLTATDQRTGRTGSGVATQVNDLWGYFSIPAITGNPNNPEIFVKMLDGTALNGSYWFFYGGLTDLEYTLTVTEVSTGRQKTYTKPAGSECGGSDTAAFTQ